MNSELRTKFRDLAKQSIPGPWEVVETPDPKMISSWSIDIDGMELSFFPYKYHYADETKTTGGYVTDHQKKATGQLIAQLNPSVVLQLLDYIDYLEERLTQ